MAYSPEFVQQTIANNILHFGHLESKAVELLTLPIWLIPHIKLVTWAKSSVQNHQYRC